MLYLAFRLTLLQRMMSQLAVESLFHVIAFPKSYIYIWTCKCPNTLLWIPRKYNGPLYSEHSYNVQNLREYCFKLNDNKLFIRCDISCE